MNRRTLIINSTVLFLVAAILELTLRECGRCVAALSLYAKPILYHNYVNYNLEGNSLTDKIFCASVGPIVSLIVGIYSHLILKNRFESRFTILFFIYLAVFGYTSFLGSIVLAPFFSDSDMGYLFNVWDYPKWFMVALAAAALPVIYLLLKNLSRHFISLMSKRTATEPELRKQYITNLVIIPWLIGSCLFVLFNLPLHTPVNLVSPILFPLALLLPYSEYMIAKAKKNRYDRYESLTLGISYFWIAMLVIAIICNRVMATGIIF